MRTLLALLLASFSITTTAFDPGRAAFAVRVNDLTIPYRVFAIYALPGETLKLAIEEPSGNFTFSTNGMTQSGSVWTFSAPTTPGLQQIDIKSEAGTDSEKILLNLFVLHPAQDVVHGKLNGFTIGAYPATPYRGNPAYSSPPGFVELTEATAAVQLSPHFTLGQFPSKQASAYPKYLVLREHLLFKLELLLERFNTTGREAESFLIMSGYRTPSYNRAIGNGPNSRHVYGGAADIYVDVDPVDGVMDDLDGNGRFDYRDAQHLYRIADKLFAEKQNRWLIGGQGVYRSNPAHGPFLHVDARGQRARWGLIP